MTCGERYRHLLATSDGKTPTNPWTLFPGPSDYDRWYAVANDIAVLARVNWDFFHDVETDQELSSENPEPYPRRDQLLYLLKQFAGRMDTLKHPLWEQLDLGDVSWEPAVRKAISIAEDGTCVLEETDLALKYYNQTPLPTTSTPEKGEESGGVAFVSLTLMMGLGYAIYQKRKARKVA